jgi:hypothetical protein
MTTLKTMRLRGDLIEVFKLLKGIEDVTEVLTIDFFIREKGVLGGHNLKLVKPTCRLIDCRKYMPFKTGY